MKTEEEIAQKAENHRDWAGPKKPSMKRRCNQHDYRDRGIYMVTLCIEGRRPLLGTLVGDPAIKEGEGKPHVVLSPLGEKVKECWLAIPRFHPVVEPMKLCIMPDHIHGLLFVHEKMEKHLGDVIWGYKTGCRKAARELGLLPDNRPITEAAHLAQPTKQQQDRAEAAHLAQPTEQQQDTPSVPYAALYARPNERRPNERRPSERRPSEAQPSRHTAAARSHGLLWESGYNDRLLRGKGQLDRMTAYMNDNPRRLLLKRLHPEYFTRLGNINVAGIPMEAMGNHFLLDNPVKLQVQCSRHLYQNEIDQQQATILAAAYDQDAILVSPCISPGEQQIATAALYAGIPLIVLLVKGFPPLFKPQKRYLDACTEGRLLMLAPFHWQNEKLEHMRQRCLQLNDIAKTICENDS